MPAVALVPIYVGVTTSKLDLVSGTVWVVPQIIFSFAIVCPFAGVIVGILEHCKERREGFLKCFE